MSTNHYPLTDQVFNYDFRKETIYNNSVCQQLELDDPNLKLYENLEDQITRDISFHCNNLSKDFKDESRVDMVQVAYNHMRAVDRFIYHVPQAAPSSLSLFDVFKSCFAANEEPELKISEQDIFDMRSKLQLFYLDMQATALRLQSDREQRQMRLKKISAEEERRLEEDENIDRKIREELHRMLAENNPQEGMVGQSRKEEQEISEEIADIPNNEFDNEHLYLLSTDYKEERKVDILEWAIKVSSGDTSPMFQEIKDIEAGSLYPDLQPKLDLLK